jgi:hypothetical protein
MYALRSLRATTAGTCVSFVSVDDSGKVDSDTILVYHADLNTQVQHFAHSAASHMNEFIVVAAQLCCVSWLLQFFSWLLPTPLTFLPCFITSLRTWGCLRPQMATSPSRPSTSSWKWSKNRVFSSAAGTVGARVKSQACSCQARLRLLLQGLAAAAAAATAAVAAFFMIFLVFSCLCCPGRLPCVRPAASARACFVGRYGGGRVF